LGGGGFGIEKILLAILGKIFRILIKRYETWKIVKILFHYRHGLIIGRENNNRT
jgi:hypothetical protein